MFAFLFSSALRQNKSLSSYVLPILYSSSLLSTIAILDCSILFYTWPIRIFALPYFANALHFFTTHCSAALFLYLTMRNLSLLCLCKTLLHLSYTKPFFTLPMQTLLRRSVPLRYITLLRFAEANHYPATLYLCFTYHNYNQPCRSLFRVVIPYECPFFSRTFFANCI